MAPQKMKANQRCSMKDDKGFLGASLQPCVSSQLYLLSLSFPLPTVPGKMQMETANAFSVIPFAPCIFKTFRNYFIYLTVAKISAHVDDLSCPLEVTKCFQLNIYIKTMALAAFWKHTHRGTQALDQITSASELLRCGQIAGILTRDVWGKSQGPCPNHSSIIQQLSGLLLIDVTAHQEEHFCCFVCLQADTKLNQLPQSTHQSSTSL